jgi:oligopeptide/dipeptide ABC transporter ATP-binding protein
MLVPESELGATETELLLDVRDLRVEFNQTPPVHAVRGLTLSIAPGESLGLVGESGSGKSVSAQALLGLLPKNRAITSGVAVFEGHDLVALPEERFRRIRGRRISIIFQDPLSSLNPVLTVGRQIAEAIQAHEKVGRAVATRRAVELLTAVGIPNAAARKDDYPHQFSGGMRQRTMIAMALSCSPALLIADEPTTALDVTVQAQILELLKRLRQELGMAVLLITHDLGVVAGFTDRLAVMYAGRVVETGLTETVLKAPRHPYTAGLLRSLPRMDHPRNEELTPIPGTPPDLSSDLVGCPFAPRCSRVMAQCLEVDPPVRRVPGVPTNRIEVVGKTATHRFACHNPLEYSREASEIVSQSPDLTDAATSDTTASGIEGASL